MLVAHARGGLQEARECLSSVYRDLRLIVNINKTQVMFHWSDERPFVDPVMKIYGTELRTVKPFTYLGSILSTDITADAEVRQMINRASAYFARIRQCIITNNNFRIATNFAVYREICLSILVYASETFTLYRRHLRQLESSDM